MTKRLKDVLENDVNDKYFLSEKIIANFEVKSLKENGFKFQPKYETDETANCILSRYFKMGATDNYLKVKSATLKGYEIAEKGDSINYSFPNSKTRKERVGKQVAQTLDTSCNQGVVSGTWRTHKDGQGFRKIEDGNCPTIPARAREDGSGQPVIFENYKIRRLTPRECFRLMDFPDSFDFSCVSDSQAYKQAGNSIVVRVLEKIIKNLSL